MHSASSEAGIACRYVSKLFGAHQPGALLYPHLTGSGSNEGICMERQIDIYSGFSDISNYLEISDIQLSLSQFLISNPNFGYHQFEMLISIIQLMVSKIEFLMSIIECMISLNRITDISK